VAIARVYGSALKGSSKDHADLADTAIPLGAALPVVACCPDGVLVLESEPVDPRL
jgi:hypothetical protein